ncbi:Ebp2-domain-containing protein [Aureobasidium subglaciale]|nr:Ebp2-domain-containing protein [Aureobasidium subglaciale]
MAKGSKLLAALDREKGVNHKLEHQKKQQKAAEKRKRSRVEDQEDEAVLEEAIKEAEETVLGAGKKEKKDKKGAKRAKVVQQEEVEAEEEAEAEDDEEWESDDEDKTHAKNIARLVEDDSEDESDSEDDINGGAELDDSEDDDEEDEDIALSDLESVASEDKGDIIPHQRLTINNTSALLRAVKSFALSSKLPFSENQVIISDAPTEIPDIEDDLNRELAFYKQSLDAVTKARGLLKKEGIPFSRPADYFAEMVKSDEHMGKIKGKLIDEAASKKASAEARRQRDLKKFGKQVQVAKLQERSREKKDTMDKIQLLKRKRKGEDIGNANEDDMFDVALEDAAETEKKDKAARKSGGASSASRDGKGGFKRVKRDEKYGFGGKKRFSKSNDAKSSGDMTGYSAKRMKGGKKGASRPGKSRRANKA